MVYFHKRSHQYERQSASWEAGQTLLIVVLVMIISLTVGLSLAARNITNTKISTEQANSQQALSAAESGIEQVLKSNVNIDSAQVFDNNPNIKILNATAVSVSGTDIPLNGGNSINKDDGFDVWLVAHNTDGTLGSTPWSGTVTFFWGSTGLDCTQHPELVPALEIIVISGATKATVTSQRYAYDPCNARSSQNKFTIGLSAVGQNVQQQTYGYKTADNAISVTNGWIVRLVPLYANAPLGVKASTALPQQGKNVTSVAQAGNAQRKITIYQGYPQVATEFFPYILFCTKTSSDATSCK